MIFRIYLTYINLSQLESLFLLFDALVLRFAEVAMMSMVMLQRLPLSSFSLAATQLRRMCFFFSSNKIQLSLDTFLTFSPVVFMRSVDVFPVVSLFLFLSLVLTLLSGYVLSSCETPLPPAAATFPWEEGDCLERERQAVYHSRQHRRLLILFSSATVLHSDCSTRTNNNF